METDGVTWLWWLTLVGCAIERSEVGLVLNCSAAETKTCKCRCRCQRVFPVKLCSEPVQRKTKSLTISCKFIHRWKIAEQNGFRIKPWSEKHPRLNPKEFSPLMNLKMNLGLSKNVIESLLLSLVGWTSHVSSGGLCHWERNLWRVVKIAIISIINWLCLKCGFLCHKEIVPKSFFQ